MVRIICKYIFAHSYRMYISSSLKIKTALRSTYSTKLHSTTFILQTVPIQKQETEHSVYYFDGNKIIWCWVNTTDWWVPASTPKNDNPTAPPGKKIYRF